MATTRHSSESGRRHRRRPRSGVPYSPDEPTANELLLTNLLSIEDVITAVSAGAFRAPDEAAEFRSWAICKLLEKDCKALRGFRGRSRIRTYLFVVISNLLRDYRNAQYGRWRPSAASVRLGPEAKDLDRLVNRDGLTVSEAVRTLTDRDDCHLSEAQLWEVARHIPRRWRPRFVELDAADGCEGCDGADARMIAAEASSAFRAVRARLDEALKDLDDEDQVILRLRFWRGLTVAEISRALGLPQKPLYRRIDRCLAVLRLELETRGLKRRDVCALLRSSRWVTPELHGECDSPTDDGRVGHV